MPNGVIALSIYKRGDFCFETTQPLYVVDSSRWGLLPKRRAIFPVRSGGRGASRGRAWRTRRRTSRSPQRPPSYAASAPSSPSATTIALSTRGINDPGNPNPNRPSSRCGGHSRRPTSRKPRPARGRRQAAVLMPLRGDDYFGAIVMDWGGYPGHFG